MGNLLRLLRRRRRSDADFAREIAAHLALEAERLVALGMAPEEAAYAARRRFGNVTLAREDYHRRRTIGWLEAIPQQVRRACRRLVRAKAFSLTAAATLTVGIGATSAVFSLVDGVLLRPLPFERPEQLVDLSHTMELQGLSRVDQSDATYLYYRRASHVFTDVGAYRSASVNLSGGGTGGGPGEPAAARRTEAARVSASVFGVLGIAPLRGRVFREDEDLPGAPPVALLGEGLWRTGYGADPGIVGRRVRIDGVTRTVVGVMPERFRFPGDRTALWLPVGIDPSKTASAAFDFRAIARLRPGTTPRAAAAELERLLPLVPEAFPGRLTAPAIRLTRMRPLVRPLRDTVVGDAGRALWVVLGAAAFLLLVACANVANLFLIRAEERQHDLVVRRALGAGRGAVVAQFFFEGLLLAALGSVLGLGLAVAGLHGLRAVDAGVAIPRLDEVGLDAAVGGVATGLTVLIALGMSVVPALRSCRPEVGSVLMQGGRGATAGRSRQRTRRAFVVAQMALALVMVTGAGLMARSFRALRSVPPGFTAPQAYAFRVALPEADYPAASNTVGLVNRALAELAALPGVASVGVTSKLPLDGEARRDTAVWVEDRPVAMGAMPDVHQVIYASPGSFGALGIPLVEGHAFEDPDPAHAPLEVVITRALARRYWGEKPAVGHRLRLSRPDGAWFTVIGVTGDVRGSGLDQPPDETVFLPLVTSPGPAGVDGGAGKARWTPRDLAFVVRSAAPSDDVIRATERTLRALAPAVPVYGVRAMEEILDRSTVRTSFTLELLELASLAALLIGAVGLYGVVSYMVRLRARELAIRMALGAAPGAVRRQIMRQAVAMAALGIVLGLGATLPLTRVLTALLFDVAPTDGATLVGAVAVLAAVAALASWLPARRAAGIDVASVLREDG